MIVNKQKRLRIKKIKKIKNDKYTSLTYKDVFVNGVILNDCNNKYFVSDSQMLEMITKYLTARGETSFEFLFIKNKLNESNFDITSALDKEYPMAKHISENYIMKFLKNLNEGKYR